MLKLFLKAVSLFPCNFRETENRRNVGVESVGEGLHSNEFSGFGCILSLCYIVFYEWWLDLTFDLPPPNETDGKRDVQTMYPLTPTSAQAAAAAAVSFWYSANPTVGCPWLTKPHHPVLFYRLQPSLCLLNAAPLQTLGLEDLSGPLALFSAVAVLTNKLKNQL